MKDLPWNSFHSEIASQFGYTLFQSSTYITNYMSTIYLSIYLFVMAFTIYILKN